MLGACGSVVQWLESFVVCYPGEMALGLQGSYSGSRGSCVSCSLVSDLSSLLTSLESHLMGLSDIEPAEAYTSEGLAS